eukprot:scaffold3628_cov112-Cylindrotheca_fusiformis.AAC.5
MPAILSHSISSIVRPKPFKDPRTMVPVRQRGKQGRYSLAWSVRHQSENSLALGAFIRRDPLLDSQNNSEPMVAESYHCSATADLFRQVEGTRSNPSQAILFSTRGSIVCLNISSPPLISLTLVREMPHVS